MQLMLPKNAIVGVVACIAMAACNRVETHNSTIDGWEIATTPKSNFDGGLIYVSRNGQELVTISDIGKNGTVIFLTGSHGEGIVEVRDSNLDGYFDFISYHGTNQTLIDNDFDGETDAIGDVANEAVQILYAGRWYELERSDGESFIRVDGVPIPFSYADGRLIPEKVD